MLIRLIIKNLYSFKDETEFNLFPSKTQGLQHHKVKYKGFDFLRFSAIYGANGSGKSNLIKSISLLEKMVEKGELPSEIEKLKFQLADENLKLPISLGVEFIAEDKVYFYTLTFEGDKILHEYLAESYKEKDVMIFERTFEDEKQQIVFHEDYSKTEKQKLFIEIIAEKLIQKNELLVTFLSKKYPDDFKPVRSVFHWFDKTLVVIEPHSKPAGIAHTLDKRTSIKDFANEFISSLNTGIVEIGVKKEAFENYFGKGKGMTEDFIRMKNDFIRQLRNDSVEGAALSLTNPETDEDLTLVYEDDELVVKRLVTKHQNATGTTTFELEQESDGTKRLIDYIPFLSGVINDQKVFVIDEIERSIHPLMIKEIMTKLALDESIKGQLIFSTHESNLLDQNILRPDEIWLAQKDFDGSSKIYSLSDFKIHHTISIENSYLKGRFGGIPFLGNLKDLNW